MVYNRCGGVKVVAETAWLFWSEGKGVPHPKSLIPNRFHVFFTVAIDKMIFMENIVPRGGVP